MPSKKKRTTNPGLGPKHFIHEETNVEVEAEFVVPEKVDDMVDAFHRMLDLNSHGELSDSMKRSVSVGGVYADNPAGVKDALRAAREARSFFEEIGMKAGALQVIQVANGIQIQQKAVLYPEEEEEEEEDKKGFYETIAEGVVDLLPASHMIKAFQSLGLLGGLAVSIVVMLGFLRGMFQHSQIANTYSKAFMKIFGHFADLIMLAFLPLINQVLIFMITKVRPIVSAISDWLKDHPSIRNIIFGALLALPAWRLIAAGIVYAINLAMMMVPWNMPQGGVPLTFPSIIPRLPRWLRRALVRLRNFLRKLRNLWRKFKKLPSKIPKLLRNWWNKIKSKLPKFKRPKIPSWLKRWLPKPKLPKMAKKFIQFLSRIIPVIRRIPFIVRRVLSGLGRAVQRGINEIRKLRVLSRIKNIPVVNKAIKGLDIIKTNIYNKGRQIVAPVGRAAASLKNLALSNVTSFLNKIDEITQKGLSAYRGMHRAVRTRIAAVRAGIGKGISATTDFLGLRISGARTSISQAIDDVQNIASNTRKKVTSPLSRGLGNVWDSAKSMGTSAFDTVKGLLDDGVRITKNLFSGWKGYLIPDFIKNRVTNFFTNASNFWSEQKRTIMNLFDTGLTEVRKQITFWGEKVKGVYNAIDGWIGKSLSPLLRTIANSSILSIAFRFLGRGLAFMEALMAITYIFTVALPWVSGSETGRKTERAVVDALTSGTYGDMLDSASGMQLFRSTPYGGMIPTGYAGFIEEDGKMKLMNIQVYESLKRPPDVPVNIYEFSASNPGELQMIWNKLTDKQHHIDTLYRIKSLPRLEEPEYIGPAHLPFHVDKLPGLIGGWLGK